MSERSDIIAGLSPAKRALLEHRLAQRSDRAAGIPRQPGDGPFPLSAAQRGLWLLDQIHPGLAAYNVGRILRLRGQLDSAALQHSLDGIFARHPGLRAEFSLAGDAPAQRITPSRPLPIEQVDVSSAQSPEPEALKVIRDELRQPFDLGGGSLLRARLIHTGRDDHLLVLTVHHIASDEETIGILFEELAAGYAAAREGREPEFKPLPLRYADYAVWESRRLAEPAIDEALAWWRRRLEGAPTELALPHDSPRPAVSRFQGAQHVEMVDSATVTGLRALGREQGATLFMVLLAAFKILLTRYSGQLDVLVGSPVSARGDESLAGVVGRFSNTVVLRTGLEGDPTFRELIARVRVTAVGAFSHQDVPFERLVEELAPARDLSRPPLVEVLFNFVERPAHLSPRFGDLRVSAMEIDPGITKVDMALMCSLRDGALRLMWEYSTEIFASSTITRMSGHMRRLLTEALQSPDTRIGDLPMLSDAEWADATRDMARTRVPIPDCCVHDQISTRARQAPDLPAVTCGAHRLSYRALDERANAIAHALNDAGVAFGATVAIRVGRSTDLVAALLGVLKAGCSYLPLDPALPLARTAYMLEDAGPAAIITGPGLELPGVRPIAVPLHDVEPGRSVPPPGRAAGLADAAYVIYTSGSTGQPKGVILEHGNLVNLLASMIREPGLGPRDRLLAVTTLSFDIAALELFGPLVAGGQVVLSEDGAASEPAALMQLIAAHEPTVMQATPSTWRMLLDGGWAGDAGLRALCGGERLSPELAASLAGRVNCLWNLYGPTETTIWSTCRRIHPADPEISIGSPIDNTACYVLDPHGRPTPPGVAGELVIGGAGVARGYHRRPELTAQRFGADPFVPGGRVYRTGDRALRRPDGSLVFLGREDHQVKLRGVRIELGEVEATLARHPAVREAVVVVREDRPGDQRLVAYVRAAIHGGELRRFAAESLPPPMVPAVVIVLERMPLTANGKLDRAALPAPTTVSPAGARTAPDGPLEQQIASVWSSLLGVEDIGRDDDFFALGGHSLLATRVVAELNLRLGRRMSPSSVFESSTVARLARALEEQHAQTSRPNGPPPPSRRAPRNLRRVAAGASQDTELLAAALATDSPRRAAASDDDLLVFPASYQQRRAWFLDRLEPTSGLYAVPLCVSVTGPVDVAALRRSLERLATRHEVLRTTLVEHDGEPLQVVKPRADLDLERASAPDLTAAHRVVRQFSVRPFQLDRGPLARALLVSIDDEQHLLALVLHHAVADGWSLQVLADQISDDPAMSHTAADAEALQYGDYAFWQRGHLNDEAIGGEIDWWRRTLEGAPLATELPFDRPRPAVPSRAGAKLVTKIAPDLSGGLERAAAETGVTLFMLLTAAVQTLIYRYTGEPDVVVGAPVSGRTRPEYDRTVGYFANTLVLRTHLRGDLSFRDVLTEVKGVVLGALAHQDVPFERLVESLAPDRDLSRNPLFQVFVMLDHDEAPLPRLGRAQVRQVEVDRGVSRFDLSLSFARRDDGLRIVLEYSRDLFEAATIERLASHLGRLFESIAADPDVPIVRLPILSSAEYREVVETFNATSRQIPTVPAHELASTMAARQPADAVAVTCDGREMTYGELEVRANQVAHALIARGARPGVLIGLRVPRSPELIVAIQGILRSGAAYIPLDPGYPRDRVAFMMADSGASLFMTVQALLPEFETTIDALCVDDDALCEWPAHPPGPRAGLHDLAYVIYTSGSTGRPKGVMIEHRSLVNLLDSMSEHPGLRAGETMLGLTTPAFDLSVPDLHLPFTQGGRLVLATADQAADPQALAALMRTSGATLAQATPSTWRMLLDDGWRPTRPMRIVVGGEAVPVSVAARLRDLAEEVWNFYGPTETTVWSTRWRVDGDITGEVPVGTPLSNTACYLLDATGSPVPRGVTGEMYIGGAGVARGYLGRPELDAELFVADPFRPGGRMYRTGDRMRLRSDGLLTFGGRGDDQVKLRGFRIELGEVASTLETHPSVRQAVVIVRGDDQHDEQLVAYVVTTEPVSIDALLAHLARTLPGYMLPNAVVFMDELPLTPNRKLDRSALPVPGPRRLPTGGAPVTPIEAQIAALWSEALRHEAVGIHENLFHLGAHSLLVTRVVARIRSTLGVDIPLRAVYEKPTVAELAKHVVAAMVENERADQLTELLDEIDETNAD